MLICPSSSSTAAPVRIAASALQRADERPAIRVPRPSEKPHRGVT
jgi:hypothetical protein